MSDRLFVFLAAVLVGAAATGAFLVFEEDPEPRVVTPKVNLETEALLNAATIEMRGYGPDGTPGVFVHDCRYDDGGQRLVCTQREGDADG